MLFEAVYLDGTIIEVEGERVYSNEDYYFVERVLKESLELTPFQKKGISVIRPKKKGEV